MASMNTFYQENLGVLAQDIANDLYEKHKNNQKMKNGYKVIKLNELGPQLGLPSSKGYKTSDYLELVIQRIEESGYAFIQFLQLIDVLYVIINTAGKTNYEALPPEEFNPEKEIRDHYSPKSSGKPSKKQKEETVEVHEEFQKAMEVVKDRETLEKNMHGGKLPWKK